MLDLSCLCDSRVEIFGTPLDVWFGADREAKATNGVSLLLSKVDSVFVCAGPSLLLKGFL